MAKNILQDIVPPEKRSIRDVPLSPRRNIRIDSINSTQPAFRETSFDQNENNILSNQKRPEAEFDRPKVYSFESARESFNRNYSKKGIWIACGVALLIVFLAVGSLFSGATVRATLKEKSVDASGVVLKAYQGSTGIGVPYEIVKISKDIGSSVTATGDSNVSDKASGVIVIYNDFGSASQRLIKNTRFATPEGLIYRINDSVVVPGQILKNGTKTPGNIEVTVYADEAGDKYNIGLKDFTIPGFKGDPRFKLIYARSKTEMKGGFVGTVKKVSDSDLKKVLADLQDQLKPALSKEVTVQIPQDYVVFQDGMIVTFDALPQSNQQGNNVQINERGTLTAIMFNKNLFAHYLAEQIAPDLASSTVTIGNLNDLTFKIQNKETFNPATDNTINFNINGKVLFINQFNKEKFLGDLAGKSKGVLPSVLTNYPEILKADVVLRPFWKRSFPSNSKDINLVIVNSK
jgi:hypothetical protein